MTRLEPRERGESGFTIVEVIAAMGVMSIVMLMGLSATGNLLNVSTDAIGKGQATTQVVAALTELRQEIISANIVFDPATENLSGTDGAGFALRIYTQLNGKPMCVEWRLQTDGELQTRTWSDQWKTDGLVHPWTTMAWNVQNPPSAVPFTLNYNTNYGGADSRLVDIDLYLATTHAASSPTVLVQSAIAGRDAEYYPANTNDCSPEPSS
ncbi:MAG: PulJ/GspJ family protein [Acidimicrobiales bacterium]